MRVLVADKLHPRAVEELRTLPVDVLYEPEITKETLESKIPGVGILIVRSKEVTRKAIESARQLNLIIRAGAEIATIDVKAASERGIYVANCPGKNSSAVAELVFGMLVAIDRRIPDAVASLRAGKWELVEYGKAAPRVAAAGGEIVFLPKLQGEADTLLDAKKLTFEVGSTAIELLGRRHATNVRLWLRHAEAGMLCTWIDPWGDVPTETPRAKVAVPA